MKKTEISLALTKKVMAFIWCMFLAIPVFAEPTNPLTRVIYFDLPGQSLQAGLVEFALQADISIVVDNQMIKGYRTSPVGGPKTLGNALAALLANTPLDYQYQAATNTYLIRPKPAQPAVAPVVTQEVDEPAPAAMEELEVRGTRLPYRYNTQANSQIDGGIAYFDSSRFINILPQQLFEDQQPVELGELLKYASGITPADGLMDTNDDAFIRGFHRHAIYLDGFRLSDTSGIKLSTANIEQVDILKGPSTLLYGQAEPGGIINVVRKKPQDETFIHAGIGAGSLDSRRLDADINLAGLLAAPMDFRLVLSLDEQDEAGEIHNIERELIAPGVKWQLADSTSIDVGYEYQRNALESRRDITLFEAYGDFPGVTLEELAAQARPGFSGERHLYSAQLNHFFSDDWRLSTKYFWSNEKRLGIRTGNELIKTTDVLLDNEAIGDNYYLFIFGGQLSVPLLLDPDTYQLSLTDVRSLYDEDAEEFLNNARITLDGTLNTGSLVHHLIMGGDWYRQDVYKTYVVEERRVLQGYHWALENADQALFDIVDALQHSTLYRGDLIYQHQQLISDDYGVFLQDSIELDDQWTAALGTRYASIQGDYFDRTAGNVTRLQTYEDFSSQAGLVYKPVENHSLFINYSEALRANYHIDNIGAREVPAELSDQVEVGLKSQLWNGRLMSSIAWFDITKNNIANVEIIDGYRTLLETYSQNSRGLDMDITLQLTPDINIIAAASFINAEITSGKHQGKQSDMVAEQTASLYAHYRWTDHWEVMGGISYLGERITYTTSLMVDRGEDVTVGEQYFVMNPYTLIDAGLAYRFDMFGAATKFQLWVNNVTDEYYFTSVLGGARVNPAAGRTFMGRIGFEF